MSGLLRSGFFLVKKSVLSTSIRALSTSKVLSIKEIREHKEGNNVVVEAVTLPSPRTELLVRPEKVNPPSSSICSDSSEQQPCYMCSLGLDLKHTDVLILSQFLRSDGCMLPRRITKLCPRQQKKIGKLVAMAQKAGLMINITPANSKKDPTKRKDHKKFNTYFDESTIFMKRIPDQNDKWKR